MTTLRMGEKYDAVQLNHQSKDGVELIEKLSEKGSYVLDLGCGTGYLATVLATRVGPNGKVCGIDPTSERIELARKNYSSIGNLQLLNKSSENYPTGPYDAVFSNHVMHWIEDKESTFQKVFDNLKFNGKFAINCVGGHITHDWKLVMKQGPLLHICTSDELKKIAVQIGFEVEFESVTYTFENVEKYTEWIIGTFEVPADMIDQAKMEEFKKQCETDPSHTYTRIMTVFRKASA